jgi:hypothetical protein
MSPSFTLLAASATAAVVFVVVSFSNLTDMAPQCYATAADSRWARGGDDAAVGEVVCGGGLTSWPGVGMAGDEGKQPRSTSVLASADTQ